MSAGFLGAGYLITAPDGGDRARDGHWLALGLSCGLAALMGPRAISARKLVKSLEVLPGGKRVITVRRLLAHRHPHVEAAARCPRPALRAR